MTLSTMPTIDELIACAPVTGDVPFFDGTCRGYSHIHTTCADILGCFSRFDFGLNSLSLDILTNDIQLTNPVITFDLTNTILTIGHRVYDLDKFLHTSFFVTDGQSNYEIHNEQPLRFYGEDGLIINVIGDEIQLGLPVMEAQYFTPGRSGEVDEEGNPIPNEDGTYMPNNKRLVLTRDDCDHVAKWQVPQCCLQSLIFNGTQINLTPRPEDSIVPMPVYLGSINTDNQTLSLEFNNPDLPHTELLSLTRRHGDALGVQVPDADSVVDLVDVAEEILVLQDKILCVQKIIQSVTSCNACRNDCVDLSVLDYDCADVTNCVMNTPIDWPTIAPDIINIPLTDPALNIIWQNFFGDGPVSINQVQTFVNNWYTTINNTLTILSDIIHRQKYWAKISLSTNRRMWSKHAGPNYSDNNNARWFIPGFDQAEGWHSSTNDMIDPAFTITADPDELIIPTLITTSFGTGYNVTKSANNINSVDANSQFAQYDCRTIKIVKTGWYSVELQGVLEADHNVNAFRYTCLRYNAVTTELDLLIDSKFGGGSSVGSGSLNNELVPCTNQYHAGGVKLLKLNAGDILFPAVKIDPRTIRPKQSNIEPTKDVLFELNNLPTPYGTFSHTPGSASGEDVSWSPGAASVVWNYLVANGGPNVSTDEFPRPTSNLPNVSPHFFTPHGGLDGAANYGWNLTYPGGNGDAAFGEYRRDDGCVTLFGPASRWNSDGSGGIEGESEGASLSVHRVNAVQH